MTKLTIEYLQELIKSTGYFKLDNTTTTLCVLELHSGFIIVGKSACIDPNDFNDEMGKEIAYKNAVDKLWELEGYYVTRLLADNNCKTACACQQ